MNLLRLISLLNCLIILPSIVLGLDTIFAKGGTCLYKIYSHYQRCMENQNARLTREKDQLEPIYTREALTDSVNKISCCAYWEFLSCVEEVAKEYCPNERHDMEAYVRQLGSAVPLEDCVEQYPRYSPQCGRSSSINLVPNLAIISVIFIIFTHLTV